MGQFSLIPTQYVGSHIVSRYCAVAGTELSNDGPKRFFTLVTLTNSHSTKGYNP